MIDLSLIFLWWLRKNKELSINEKVKNLYEIITDLRVIRLVETLAFHFLVEIISGNTFIIASIFPCSNALLIFSST